MENEQISRLINPVKDILINAGNLMLQYQDRDMQIEKKSADNYVTETDVAVQKFIVGHLRHLTSEYAYVTEEGKASLFDYSRPTWILDPIDGTTNFMRHYRHSAISLALCHEEQINLAFIYNPYNNEMFWAADGQGSYLNGSKIAVSGHEDLKDCLIGFGTTPYAREQAHRTFVIAEKVFQQSLEIRRSGSAALDLAYIACGRLDGFFEFQLQPWDYAAGILLLREAGGKITNWQGKLPDLYAQDSILASNGKAHAALLADLIAKTY